MRVNGLFATTRVADVPGGALEVAGNDEVILDKGNEMNTRVIAPCTIESLTGVAAESLSRDC